MKKKYFLCWVVICPILIFSYSELSAQHKKSFFSKKIKQNSHRCISESLEKSRASISQLIESEHFSGMIDSEFNELSGVSYHFFKELNEYYHSLFKEALSKKYERIKQVSLFDLVKDYLNLYKKYKSECLHDQSDVYKDGKRYLTKSIYNRKNFDESLMMQSNFSVDICDNLDFSSDYQNYITFCARRNFGVCSYDTYVEYTPPDRCHFLEQHTFVTGGVDDALNLLNVQLPRTRPGGNGKSMVIGDFTGIGSRVGGVRRTFTVDPSTPYLTFYYAAVLEDPSNGGNNSSHDANDMPYFKMSLLDQDGNSISCSEYQSYPGDGAEGWIPAIGVLGNVDIIYRDWTTVYVPLDNYIGSNVTLEIVAGDCAPGAHYGYAYLEFEPCSGIQDIQIDCSTTPPTLKGPEGVESYLWNTGETTQSITPQQTGTYTLEIVPLGATEDCKRVLSVDYVDLNAEISEGKVVCVGEEQPEITFTASGGVSPYTFVYQDGLTGQSQTIVSSGDTATITVPTATAGSFTYELISVSDSSDSRTISCPKTYPQEATVEVVELIQASVSGDIVVCKSNSTATVTFNASNSLPPYEFVYNINGSDSQTITSTNGTATIQIPTNTVGVYQVNLEQVNTPGVVNSCGANITANQVTIEVTSAILAHISGDAEVCKDDLEPVVTFQADGGVLPYTFNYSINNGPSQSISTSNTSGVVTLSVPTSIEGNFNYELLSVIDSSTTVSDCPVDITNNSISIEVKPNIGVVITGVSQVCQNQTNASLVISCSNGISPYTISYTVNSGPVQVVTTTMGSSTTLGIDTSEYGTFDFQIVGVSDSGALQCTSQQINHEVVVNSLPVPVLDPLVICLDKDGTLIDSAVLNSGLLDADYTFQWYYNGNVIAGENSSELELDQQGTYSVVATHNLLGCVSEMVTVQVDGVEQIQAIEGVHPELFIEDSIEVQVIGGVAPFAFQLDDSPVQSSNVFEDIPEGFHTLAVYDQSGCSMIRESFIVVKYPPFFTPNGDGVNEIWDIKSLSKFEGVTISIYDRLGKLLFQFTPGAGWNGRYNGVEMPSSDYWFSVDYISPVTGKSATFKSHFSLKR